MISFVVLGEHLRLKICSFRRFIFLQQLFPYLLFLQLFLLLLFDLRTEAEVQTRQEVT